MISSLNMREKNKLLFTMISQANGYHLKNKEHKSKILDEFCKITGQNRKAVIRKIRSGQYIKTMKREKGELKTIRPCVYTKDLVALLIQVWDIFDRPCGQRLKPLLKTELPRLRNAGEIILSNDAIEKLQNISARSIDAKLAPHKEKERINRKYSKRLHPLLYQKIPVKLSYEQNRGVGETIQIDIVEHCGQSPLGKFINTVSTTDISTGWWEGKAIFGKVAKDVHQALFELERRYPFVWREIHPDNGSEFINAVIYDYTLKGNIAFSRSRPFGKNDNCFIEQKNSTHVRKIVGHQRYDTEKQLRILNALYLNDLGLYKNFFQPIIPLLSKERIGGKLKRKYGEPKTPYQNVLSASNISKEKKEELTKIYQILNPAELKRRIKQKQDVLFKILKQREAEKTLKEKFWTELMSQPKIELKKGRKLINFSVANLIAETVGVR